MYTNTSSLGSAMRLRLLLITLLFCGSMQAQRVAVKLSLEWRDRAKAWPDRGWWQRTLLHDLSPKLDTLSRIPFLRIEYHNKGNKNCYVPTIATSYGGFAPVGGFNGTICSESDYGLSKAHDPLLEEQFLLDTTRYLVEGEVYNDAPRYYTLVPFFFSSRWDPEYGKMHMPSIEWTIDEREELIPPREVYEGEGVGSAMGYARLQWYLYVSSISDSLVADYSNRLRAEEMIARYLRLIIYQYDFPDHAVLLPAHGVRVEYLNLLAFSLAGISFRVFIPSDIFHKDLFHGRGVITDSVGKRYVPYTEMIKSVTLQIDFSESSMGKKSLYNSRR